MAFGKTRNIAGAGGVSAEATAVPVGLLSDLKRNVPIPITISGANQVTFTVAASKTNPVRLWNGNDYIEIRESKAYTWIKGENAVLSSAEVETTLTDTTVAVYYFYMGLDSSGNLDLLPSATAPSFVEGPKEGPVLGHPGTSRGQFWSYVGYHVGTTAATPAFLAATKLGYLYQFADQSIATTATWAVVDFSAVVPAHGPLGAEVSGFMETGANGTVAISGGPTAGQGVQKVSDSAGTSFAPFAGVVPTSGGQIWAIDTVARGDVHITGFKDIV